MSWRRTIVCFVFAVPMASGCQLYHAKPLDSSATSQALIRPSDKDIQIRVNDLHHVMLPPLQLHPELGLSPDEAAVMAVVLNPSLRASRAQLGLAQATLIQAGILPNPQLAYSYDWNTGGNTQGAVNAYGFGLNYDVTALIDHQAKVKSAEANADSVHLSIAWQEWQTAEAARTALFDLLALNAQVRVAKEIDDRLAENYKVVSKAASLNLKTAVDLSAAESALQDAHATLLQTERDREHSRLQLNRAIGLPADTQIHLRPAMELPTRFDPPGTDSLVQNIEARRLDLAALRKGYDSQEQTLRVAVLDQFPKINLGFNRAKDNSNVRSIGLGVNIDLPIFDRNQGVIATETATRQRLFDEYTARLFDARADIATAIADIHAIDQQIIEAQAAVKSLQNLVDGYKQATEHGNADVLSYYIAWNSLAQRSLDVLKLQQQLASTRVALELAAGQYFPDPSIIQVSERP